jgi:hypothetical protein
MTRQQRERPLKRSKPRDLVSAENGTRLLIQRKTTCGERFLSQSARTWLPKGASPQLWRGKNRFKSARVAFGRFSKMNLLSATTRGWGAQAVSRSGEERP